MSVQNLSAFAMPLFDSEASSSTAIELGDGVDSHRLSSSGRGEALTPTGGGGGGGIKNWFRKRQKSGEPEARGGGSNASLSSALAAKQQQQQQPSASQPSALLQQPSPKQGTKMKHLLDSFRPRSRSDVASMNAARSHHKSKSSGQAISLVQTTVPGSADRSPQAKKFSDQSVLDDVPVRNIRRGGGSSGAWHNNGVTDKMSSDSLSPSTPTRSGGHIGPEEFLEMYRERAYTDPRRVKEAALAARNKLKRVSRPRSRARV